MKINKLPLYGTLNQADVLRTALSGVGTAVAVYSDKFISIYRRMDDQFQWEYNVDAANEIAAVTLNHEGNKLFILFKDGHCSIFSCIFDAETGKGVWAFSEFFTTTPIPDATQTTLSLSETDIHLLVLSQTEQGSKLELYNATDSTPGGWSRDETFVQEFVQAVAESTTQPLVLQSVAMDRIGSCIIANLSTQTDSDVHTAIIFTRTEQGWESMPRVYHVSVDDSSQTKFYHVFSRLNGLLVGIENKDRQDARNIFTGLHIRNYEMIPDANGQSYPELEEIKIPLNLLGIDYYPHPLLKLSDDFKVIAKVATKGDYLDYNKTLCSVAVICGESTAFLPDIKEQDLKTADTDDYEYQGEDIPFATDRDLMLVPSAIDLTRDGRTLLLIGKYESISGRFNAKINRVFVVDTEALA